MKDLHVYLGRKRLVRAHRDFTRFIILTRSRSGSNLLWSYLRRHPNIHIEGEILAHRKGRHVEVYLDRFFGYQPRRIRASGFKIFYYHPMDDNSGEVWEALAGIKDLKVIHLKRDNLLEVQVSWKKAMLSDQWVAGTGGPAPARIRLDPRECEEAFRRTLAWQKQAGERFAGQEVMELTYEDFIRDPSGQLDAVQEFLQVAVRKLGTEMKKQQKKPVREVVSNYEEIRNHFKDSPWHRFFEQG